MGVSLLQAPFDPWATVGSHVAKHPALQTEAGATSVFVGTMRAQNQGAVVAAMTLEHYPMMTQKYLEGLRDEALTRWGLLDLLIVHRYGELAPGDPIVLVAAWSAHRYAAFDACRAVMEELKARAPFWKRELTANGPRWVTPDS